MSSGLLTNATSRFTVDVDVVTPGHTFDIQSLQLVPGVGTDGARLMKFKLFIDGTVEMDFTVSLSDVMFEAYNIFGGEKTQVDQRRQLGGTY